MRSVCFEPSRLAGSAATWFGRWSRRAQIAAAKTGPGHANNFSPAVWGALKYWYFENVFHRKCAYCEWKLGRSFGAADHYRPKGRVRERSSNGSHMVVQEPSSGQPHPGYYWLAYDWRNILPSCDRCNSGGGKLDQFDIAGSRVFSALGAVDEIAAIDALELPLLLNPLVDRPEAELVFGEFGAIAPRNGSARGSYTIEVLGLDDERLTEDRRERQDIIRSACKEAIIGAIYNQGSVPAALSRVRERFCSAESEFSASALAAFEAELKKLALHALLE